MMTTKQGDNIMNAKQELFKVLKMQQAYIVAAQITIGTENFILYKDYKDEDVLLFHLFIDQDYDQGYGDQQLTGYVWLSDGSWLQRQSYDGSEYWIHNKKPTIPTKQSQQPNNNTGENIMYYNEYLQKKLQEMLKQLDALIEQSNIDKTHQNDLNEIYTKIDLLLEKMENK
jgi:hypothetical protein